ncbi:unnamed protein product [Orchesella dallaii]|uniref:Gustatory receptor n=1 Tax=Orchesella dallaii TaxID=48710 RepID=A0ABP1RVG6_9HEXA
MKRVFFKKFNRIPLNNYDILNKGISYHAKLHIDLCKFVKLTPFNWNSNEAKIEIKEENWKSGRILVYAIHLTILLLMLYETIQNSILRKDADSQGNFVRMTLLILQIGTPVYHQVVWSDTLEFCALLNGLLNFNKLQIGNLNNSTVRMVLSVVKISTLLCPLSFAMVMIFAPMTPPFPTSLITLRETWNRAGFLILVEIVEIWNMLEYMLHGYFICSVVILANAGIYIGIKSIENRSIKSALPKYRIIQLLAVQTNVCFRNSVHLSITFVCILLGIVCNGAVVKYYNLLSPRALVAMVVVGAQTNVIGLLCYRIPGMVNWMSRALLQNWKRELSRRRNVVERKCLRSLSQLKVQFGNVNFFERKTCLVVVDFQIQQTINMLLLMQ